MFRRTWTLEEINVWRKKYGHKITPRELLMSLTLPGVALYCMSFILYRYIWVSGVYAIIGALYAYRFSLPALARRQYEMRSYRERNRFINILSQKLTNKVRPFLKSLREVARKLHGELKEDVSQLAAKIRDATDEEKVLAIQELKKKYKKDIAFSHFCEQLITVAVVGRVNKSTLEQIAQQHNEVLMERNDFIEKKLEPKSELLIMTFVSFICLYVMTYEFSLKSYLNLYAHQPMGWLLNTVYFIVYGIIYQIFMKNYVDDEIEVVKL